MQYYQVDNETNSVAINNCEKNDLKHENIRSSTHSLTRSHTPTVFIDAEFWPYGFPHWNKIYFMRNAKKISPFVLDFFYLYVFRYKEKVFAEEFFIFRDYRHNRSKVLSLFHETRESEKWQPIELILFSFLSSNIFRMSLELCKSKMVIIVFRL